MTSRGLTPGPGVANFVFAAATKNHFPDPRGRYRDKPSEWCPYFPPENHKIINLARQVAHRQHIEFREIRIDQHLEIELKSACERKNLTLVVADAQSLEHCSAIKVFDPEDWQGTAVLMPWHGGREAFEHHRSNISLTFPIRSREASRPFLAPIETKAEFESRLEITLTELQAAVINAGAVGRGNPDDPPAILVGPGGGG